VRATTGVAHFACAIAFTLVMHRTHLAGLKSRTADVVVRHGYGLTAERQRRGDNAGYLAGEPEADHPRQALADDPHRELDQISTRFGGMIGPQSREITLPRPIQFAIVIISFLVTFAAAASAQDADQIPPQPHEHQHALTNSSVWTWTTDASVIAGYNYQQRKFADFWAYESQNWFMAMGQRQLGAGILMLNGMISLEPWTIGRLVYAHGLDGPVRVY